MDSKINRCVRRTQLRAQRRKQYKSWQLALSHQSDSNPRSICSPHQRHNLSRNSTCHHTTATTSCSQSEAGEVGEPLMHTQSPKALVSKFPMVDSPAPPKEIPHLHTTTARTAQQQTSTSSTHEKHPDTTLTQRNDHSTHTRHSNLISRGKHNVMRQHFKTTHRHTEQQHTQPLQNHNT